MVIDAVLDLWTFQILLEREFNRCMHATAIAKAVSTRVIRIIELERIRQLLIARVYMK